MGHDKGTRIITGWSIAKRTGVSLLTISLAIQLAKVLKDKRILWMTTNTHFCPIDRALAIKCDKYQKTIDMILDHISENNSNELNNKIIDEAVIHINGVDNLSVILESNSKNSNDYIEKKMKKNFKEIILPVLKKHYDIIIIDTVGFIFSDATKMLVKMSDLVINVLAQSPVVMDEYLNYRNELINKVGNRLNVVNAYRRNLQPDLKTIRNLYEKTVFTVNDDLDFISACNTGNLLSYLGKEAHIVKKDIDLIVDVIMDNLNMTPPPADGKMVSTTKKSSSFIPGLFNFNLKAVVR